MTKLEARSSQAVSRGGATPRKQLLTNLQNKPGVFLSIPTSSLKIDTEYQRPLSGRRVDFYAADWSWIACGCITVALRGPGSGDYYVVDGQHRVEAAKRAGIPELPCLVFESVTHIDEAQGFLDSQLKRATLSIVDRYRALLVVEDPVALRTKQHLESAQRNPVMSGTAFEGDKIKCLEFLMSAVSLDDEALTTIWPLVNDLCQGKLITKDIFQGLFYIERHLSNSSITERSWRRRLLLVGYDTLRKSIAETIAFEGKSGAAINARGILRALNKGLRRKLTIDLETSDDPATSD